MAVVAMPSLHLPTPRSRSGSVGGPVAAATAPMAGGGAQSSSFRHLTFDSARGLPGERAVDRDRLRNKLVDVGQRFIGFDKVIESDTVKRRQIEMQKHTAAQEGLIKLEKAMNSEIKRRVDANKQVQALTEHMANDMLEKLQANIVVRIEKLAASIESLTLRCSALEKGIAQFRGELPTKLQVDTAALVKEICELRRQWDADRKTRIDRDTQLLRHLAEMESGEARQFEASNTTLEKQAEQLKTDINKLARSEDINASRTEKFRGFILEEIAGMKNTLAVTAQEREQTDDEIVQAMNQYTNALQKGLHSANTRSG